MRSNKRLVATCAVLLLCNAVILFVFIRYAMPKKCIITIQDNPGIVSIIPQDFLSFGIDASEIQNYTKVPFSNEKFRELASALAPARLRLGGTMSDRLIFSEEDIESISCEECHHNQAKPPVCSTIKRLCKHKFLPFFIMTGSKWIEINEFCKASNIKLLFSLNVMLRNEKGWVGHNAEELFEFSQFKEYDIDWQLGNEPNSFEHTFNVSILPEQLSHDFKNLHNLLGKYGFENSLLVGPDTTRPQPNRPECLKYMQEFLGNGSNFINVRSWHQYYLNSRTATLDDFWNPKTFHLLNEQIDTMKANTENYNDIPMWLTETSSSYGGGAPGLSNSFAGTPLWIDKLGLAAKNNITLVIRQSFFGGNYSLINHNLEPLPDWWVSVLFKKLVGSKVLDVTCNCTDHQHIYVHCANPNYTNDTSAITIYGVNLKMAKMQFLLNGAAFDVSDLSIDEYIVRPPSNNRMSKTVLLNGWPLFYESHLPELEPVHLDLRTIKQISMPPYSIGFWVVKNTAIKICK